MRIVAFAILAAALASGPALADPLPSWNEADAKAAIVSFVEGRHRARLAGVRDAGGPGRRLRQRRHALVGEAGLLPVPVRDRRTARDGGGRPVGPVFRGAAGRRRTRHGDGRLDDKGGKPLAIDARIGRRPIFAAGNSDGDVEMLEWTTAGDRARLGMIVRHTDAEREWACDRDGHVGRLDRGLDEADARGWIVVDTSGGLPAGACAVTDGGTVAAAPRSGTSGAADVGRPSLRSCHAGEHANGRRSPAALSLDGPALFGRRRWRAADRRPR